MVQESREAYGAHTVKRWWTGRACGTHKRERSEGRSKGEKVVARKKTKNSGCKAYTSQQKKIGLGAGDKFGEVRRREKGLSWCRSVWGDGGQRTHVTTGARDRWQYLFASLSRNG